MRWTALLVVLLILLNLGGAVSIIFNIGQGHWRWVGDLAFVVVMDVVGVGLLRALRE